MDQYIFGIRNDISIIDLGKTKEKINEAAEYVKNLTSKGGVILFVGTKRQAKQAIKDAAIKHGMPYVSERWLGGTFTNFDKISTGIMRLKEMTRQKESGELEKKYNKKEILEINREIIRLEEKFGGIKNMTKLPDAIFVVDIKEEEIAIAEAVHRKVPIIAVIDTNVNPSAISYPIPANDDAIKSVELVVGAIADAIEETKVKK